MKNLKSALEKVGQIISRKYNINVVCKGNKCATDSKTIYLPAIPEELPSELERSINGYLDHECGHILYSDFEVIKPFKETHGEKAFDILNIVEDARINRAIGERYIGADLNIKTSNEYVYRKITEAGTDHMSPWQKLSMDICSRALGLDSSIFGPKVNHVVDSLSEELAEIPGLKSTQEAVELSIRIIEKLGLKQQAEPEQGPEGVSESKQSSNDNTEGNSGESSLPPETQDESQQNQEQNKPEAGGHEREDTDKSSGAENTAGVGNGENKEQKPPEARPQNITHQADPVTKFIEDCRLDDSSAGNTLAVIIEREINELALSKKSWRVYDPGKVRWPGLFGQLGAVFK